MSLPRSAALAWLVLAPVVSFAGPSEAAPIPPEPAPKARNVARVAATAGAASATLMASGFLLSDAFQRPATVVPGQIPESPSLEGGFAVLGVVGYAGSALSALALVPLAGTQSIRVGRRAKVSTEAGFGALALWPVAGLATLATAYGYTDGINHGPMLALAGSLGAVAILTRVELHLADRNLEGARARRRWRDRSRGWSEGRSPDRAE